MIAIAKLAHLTELRLSNLEIDSNNLDVEGFQLVSLRILKFRGFSIIGPGSNFCRIFSRLCPNLEELDLSYLELDDHDEPHDIEPHLSQFANLRKHNISYNYH